MRIIVLPPLFYSLGKVEWDGYAGFLEGISVRRVMVTRDFVTDTTTRLAQVRVDEIVLPPQLGTQDTEHQLIEDFMSCRVTSDDNVVFLHASTN